MTGHSAIPFHPVVFAAAYVINSALAAGIHPSAGGRALAIVVLGAVLITVAAGTATRSRHIGAAIASGVIAALMLAHGVRIVGVVASRMAPWQSVIWLALIVVAALVCLRLIHRSIRRVSLRQISGSLNVLSLILAGVVGGTAIWSGQAGHAIGEVNFSPTRSASVASRASTAPDIILVVLDGYPRADTLESTFGYDNGDFLDGLRDRGFFVADRARSNYTWTQLTLASMFHMRHLEDLPAYRDIAAGHLQERQGFRQLLDTPPAIARLDELGYETFAVPPGIDWVTLRSVDHVLDPGTLSEFEYHLLRATGIDVFLSVVAPDFIGGQHRDRVLAAFDSIEAVATDGGGPRFVLGHMLSPHMPAVFHRDGSFRRPALSDNIFADVRRETNVTTEDWVAEYVEQLTYLNGRLLQMVDTVAAANPESVIILMSDHGSGVDWYWTEATRTDERLSTLFAARTPGKPKVFTGSQTPVNIFPLLLNSYFDEEWAVHPDRTYLGSLELVEIPNPDSDQR